MDVARAALTSSSGARTGSNWDFTSPVTPRSTNALRPPRSDPQSVRLWKVCGVQESAGVRRHPSSCKAEFTSSPPEPSTFYHERHSSSSLFPALWGNGQHRRTAGTNPPRDRPSTKAPPRSLCHPRPAGPSSNPASAAQHTSPLRALPKLLRPAQLGAALPSSARHGTSPLTCLALLGAARLGSAPRCLSHRRVTSLPAPPRPRLLQLLRF